MEEENVEYYCYRNKTCTNEFFTQLNTLRKSGLYCDVILVSCDGMEFPVHRVVLAAGCMYFHILFNTNIERKQQTRVTLKTVSSSALSELLDYVYTGALRVSKDTVIDLIFASSMFLFLDLTEYCWTIYVKTLDLSNCILRKVLAESISSASIVKTVSGFVLANFVKLSSDDLVECPERVLREMLSSEELVVDSELDVLRVFLKWFTASSLDQQNLTAVEKRCCEELLDFVRFKFISLNKQEIGDYLQSFGIKQYSWLFKSVLERCERRSGLAEARFWYREMNVVMVVGGQGEMSVLNEVCAFVPGTGQCCRLSAMHHPRRSFGLVASESAVFVVGGTMEKLAESSVPLIERYDIRKDAWEEVHVTSSSELERDNASIVGYQDRIVISGGLTLVSGLVASSVIELDPTSGEWRELENLHTAREGHVSVVSDVGIYVIGGKNHTGFLKSVEKFDPDTETWSVLKPMNIARCHACAVWHNNKLYVIGGYDGENVLNSAEMYDPRVDRWQLLPTGMATPRMRFAVSVCGNRAYVIGGMTGSRGPMTCDVEKYSFLDCTWTSASSMAESKMEMNCATVSVPCRFLRNSST